jgi:hypothetical protein
LAKKPPVVVIDEFSGQVAGPPRTFQIGANIRF